MPSTRRTLVSFTRMIGRAIRRTFSQAFSRTFGQLQSRLLHKMRIKLANNSWISRCETIKNIQAHFLSLLPRAPLPPSLSLSLALFHILSLSLSLGYCMSLYEYRQLNETYHVSELTRAHSLPQVPFALRRSSCPHFPAHADCALSHSCLASFSISLSPSLHVASWREYYTYWTVVAHYYLSVDIYKSVVRHYSFNKLLDTPEGILPHFYSFPIDPYQLYHSLMVVVKRRHWTWFSLRK